MDCDAISNGSGTIGWITMVAMDESAVQLTFRYSQDDYLRAARAHVSSRLRVWLDIVVASLAVIGAFYLWRFPDMRWMSITLLCALGIFVFVLVASYTIVPILTFRREPKFRDEYSLTFSPQGIHFKTAHIDSLLQWDLYSRALVDSKSFVLYYGERSFTIIPQRVFQNKAQQELFARLLAEHVPNITKL
jgi:hypothetical protein